jgi:hypothetical protein
MPDPKVQVPTSPAATTDDLLAPTITAWAAVRGWWDGTIPATQHVALWVAAIVTAAAVVRIAYLLGSGVRGRAAVATETVRARAAVAEAFVRAAASSPASAPAGTQELRVVALPALPAKNVLKSGTEQHPLPRAKGSRHEWVAATAVELV